MISENKKLPPTSNAIKFELFKIVENFRDDNIPLVIISPRFLVFAVSGKLIIKLICINEDRDIADRPR